MAFTNFSTPPDISLSSIGYNQIKCVIFADSGYPSSLGIQFWTVFVSWRSLFIKWYETCLELSKTLHLSLDSVGCRSPRVFEEVWSKPQWTSIFWNIFDKLKFVMQQKSQMFTSDRAIVLLHRIHCFTGKVYFILLLYTSISVMLLVLD